MKRTLLPSLKEWLVSDTRQPLILRGARQVGKTWLARAVAQESGKQLLELNFEKRPDLKKLFVSNDPKNIISNLEALFDKSINGSDSLLFLDEIQAAPEVLATLRWFYEDYPELPVIAAGSLLEFTLSDHTFSMPVGRIQYKYVEPLSFEEYLVACGREKLCDFLQAYTMSSDIPSPIHDELMTLTKEYLVIGGMPAAVAAWKKTNDASKVSQVHHNLLSTYRDDFNKYAARLPVERLDDVLSSIPKQLSAKFMYRRVNQDVQTGSLKNALSLLIKAKIAHKVQAVHANGVPLAAESHDKIFKVILLDVGLISTLLGLDLQVLNATQDLQLINQGGLSEQLVGQLLRIIFPDYIDPSLYYWVKEKNKQSAKIDYAIQHKNKVIPIEVKSGNTGKLRSLHVFMGLKESQQAVRIYSGLPNITTVDVTTYLESPVHYQLLSIPFYLMGQLPRLLDELFG